MNGRVVAIRRTPRKVPARRRHALQFLIVLLQSNPLIWRRIHVPDDYSFWDLHVAIQDAMGWQDCHLHEFRVVRSGTPEPTLIGIPDSEFPDERPLLAGWQVPIHEFFNWDTLSLSPPAWYVYDFGDEWQHLVTLEDIAPRSSAKLPRCIGGERACPPEDCGGVDGFRAFVEAVSNPKHPDHRAMRDWCGGEYDPGAFDPEHVVFDNPKRRWRRAFER